MYKLAHRTILEGLDAGLEVSKKVKPRGLVQLVQAALRKEIGLVQLGEHFRGIRDVDNVFKWRVCTRNLPYQASGGS